MYGMRKRFPKGRLPNWNNLLHTNLHEDICWMRIISMVIMSILAIHYTQGHYIQMRMCAVL